MVEGGCSCLLVALDLFCLDVINIEVFGVAKYPFPLLRELHGKRRQSIKALQRRRFDLERADRYYSAYNCASKDGRKEVTVRASFDDGKTYPISKFIDADRGRYIEVVIDNSVGFVYLVCESDWEKMDYIAAFDYG